MLDQGDERQLAKIAEWIRSDDPEFAAGLFTGQPRPPKGDRRWPFMAAGIAGLVVVFVGLLVASPVVCALGASAALLATAAYRRHVHAAHGRPAAFWKHRA